MISAFAIGLAVHLGFSIAAGIFSIYTMFARDSSGALDTCIKNATQGSNATQTPDDISKTCKKGLIILKAIVVTIYVLTWLIQLCKFFFSYYILF